MSEITTFKFAVLELGKHSARSCVTLFTLLVLTRWISWTYLTHGLICAHIGAAIEIIGIILYILKSRKSYHKSNAVTLPI